MLNVAPVLPTYLQGAQAPRVDLRATYLRAAAGRRNDA
jgi:hypothetical protein